MTRQWKLHPIGFVNAARDQSIQLEAKAFSISSSFQFDGGVVGGGSVPRARRDLFLAHNGLLFLDEMPEFERKVLDSLREPLESVRSLFHAWLAKLVSQHAFN